MDVALRLAFKRYEADPTLENANALIEAYRRAQGTPSNAEFLVRKLISDEDVRHLLITAFEGGANYWYFIWDWHLAPGLTYEDFRENGKMTLSDYNHPLHLIPFVPGCSLTIVSELEDENLPPRNAREGALPEGVTGYVLDRDTIWRGLQLMADQFPQQWARFVDSDYDASTGDLFLQLALFGEERYN